MVCAEACSREILLAALQGFADTARRFHTLFGYKTSRKLTLLLRKLSISAAIGCARAHKPTESATTPALFPGTGAFSLLSVLARLAQPLSTCRCGGDTADVVLYAQTTCTDASQVPGITMKLTQANCFELDPAVAVAIFDDANPMPKAMRITDSQCNVPTFAFSTCGSSTCTEGGSTGCADFILPQNAACAATTFYNFKVTTDSAANTVDVSMFPLSDADCSQTALAATTDMAVDGTQCEAFGPGGAKARPAPNVPVSPKTPATLPAPAPTNTLKCWVGLASGSQGQVQKAPTVTDADDAYCVSYTAKMEGNTVTAYQAMTVGTLLQSLVQAKSSTGIEQGIYQNLQYCNTEYCNDPAANTGSDATSTAIAWSVGALATGVAAYMTA
jgi:hypothetical protein